MDVFIIIHIIYINDITFLFSIFNLFRTLSVVSNLEPRCVAKQIGHIFILYGSDSSLVSVIWLHYLGFQISGHNMSCNCVLKREIGNLWAI